MPYKIYMAPIPPPTRTDKIKQEYMAETFRNRFYPQNEFEHKTKLLDSEFASETNIRETMKHSQIVDSHVQTATIGPDELMTAIQMDSPFLHSGLSMAKRNLGLVAPFELMFFSWRDGMLLTKAKDGQENREQHAAGRAASPNPYGPGYGSNLPQYQPEAQKKSFGDQLRGIFGGQKKS
jgi:hypothetical protein